MFGFGIWEKHFTAMASSLIFSCSLCHYNPCLLFYTASFLLGVPNPVDGLLLIAAILTPSVFIEASTACKCFIPLLFIIKPVCQTGVVVTYALMVGCFSCFCSPDEWTTDNGHNLLHGHEGILLCVCFFFQHWWCLFVCVYVCARVCFLSFFIMFA